MQARYPRPPTPEAGDIVPKTLLETGRIHPMMTKMITVLAGALMLLTLGATAQAKPTPPPPPYTPAYETVATDRTLNPGAEEYISAECPSGKTLTGGGFRTASASGHMDDLRPLVVVGSYPANDRLWAVLADVDAGAREPITLTVYAICANTAATN